MRGPSWPVNDFPPSLVPHLSALEAAWTTGLETGGLCFLFGTAMGFLRDSGSNLIQSHSTGDGASAAADQELAEWSESCRSRSTRCSDFHDKPTLTWS